MDLKFLLVLLVVEIGSLIFNIFDIGSSEIHVYNAYNQIPLISHISLKPYSCFSSVNYCIYGSIQLRFLKILDLIFISIIILCYLCLSIIILRKSENIKIRRDLKISWYASVELVVLFTLALHALLTIILFERNTTNIDQCNKQNRLIRTQNIFYNFILCLIEATYIAFDLINRQYLTDVIPIQSNEQLRLQPSTNNQRIIKTFHS